MWVCGLKPECVVRLASVHCVTPYVGVWIETLPLSALDFENCVTPYVGVWIETSSSHTWCVTFQVTPYVGVWIETNPF